MMKREQLEFWIGGQWAYYINTLTIVLYPIEK